MIGEMNLETVLQDLHGVTGCRISILDPMCAELEACPHAHTDFCRLIRRAPALCGGCSLYGKRLYSLCRGESIRSVHCPFGLLEVVAPLYYGGALAGYLVMGEALDASVDRETLIRELITQDEDHAVGEDEWRRAVEALPVIERERFEGYIGVMKISAAYITSSAILHPSEQDLPHQVKQYISRHYAERFTLNELCEALGCSRSTVSLAFRNTYGTTIFTCLNEVRMSHARRLLLESNLPIRAIAQECGFPEQGYFTKVFTAETGMSPSEFRHRVRDSEREWHS